jgi:hypothetical protein
MDGWISNSETAVQHGHPLPGTQNLYSLKKGKSVGNLFTAKITNILFDGISKTIKI